MHSLHARIQFLSGGGGRESRPDGQKTAWTKFIFAFFSPRLILQLTEGSNGFITEKTILFQGFRGVQLFPGAGVQMFNNFYIETHITCDFPGGSELPIPSLWIRTLSHRWITLLHYMCILSILLPMGYCFLIFLLLSGILDI